MRGGRFLVVAVTTVAAMAGSTQALAAPATDATVVFQGATIPAGQSGGLALPCSPGRAIAGGVEFPYPNSHLIASNPLDQDGTTSGTDDGDTPRFWYSSAYNGEVLSQTATFYALCSAATDATVQAADFPLEPAEKVSMPVDCPTGQRAIGGGLGSTANLANGAGTNPRLEPGGPLNAADAIAADGEVAGGWLGGASNLTDESKDFVAFAVCSTDSRARVRATDEPGTFLGPSKTCIHNLLGEVALGGGDLPLAPADWYPTAIVPHTQDGVPVGWRFWHDTTTPERVSAICEPLASSGGGTPITPTPNVVGPTGQQAAALAKCKKKKSKKKRKKCRKAALLLPV